MKKPFNILLIGIISLLVLPFVVSAETKIFGDVKYIIEEKDAKEYVCEEIKDHELEIFPYSQLKLYVNDKTDGKVYIVDITNPGVCNDDNDYVPSESLFLVWGEDNKIYEVEYDTEFGFIELYVDSLGHDALFITAQGEYNQEEAYYIQSDNSAELVKEEDKNQIDFDAGQYLVMLEPKSKKLLGQIDPSNLVAPKEKTGLTEDITFTKEGFIGIVNFNNQTYYAFYDETLQQYTAIFDEEGNYQTFGQEKLIVNTFSSSTNGEYILLTSEQDGKQIFKVLDTSYNLVLSKEFVNFLIHFIGKNENTEYIFNIDYNNMQSKLISITKTTIETENVPNTYDGITISIIISIITLLGLVATIILYRKKLIKSDK